MHIKSIIVCACLVAFSTAQNSIEDAFAAQVRRFSGEMYTSILADSENNVNNLIYSPLSIYETLGMVLAGSQGNTTIELLQAMEVDQGSLPGIEERDVHGFLSDLRYTIEEDTRNTGQTLLVANAMFVHSAFALKETYLGTLRGKYGAHHQSINMGNSIEARDTINDWIEENTNGQIQDLVKRIHPLTRVVLANAVYFNAVWEHSFLQAQLMDFTLADGRVVQREAMTADGFYYLDYNFDTRMSFLAIPYESLNNDTSFFVVGLPDTDSDLSEFNANAGNVLRSLDIRNWTFGNRLLQLPKFEITTELDVKPILQDMGVMDLFSEQRSNLIGISDSPLYVSEFAHKAFITVNEEGTEASAATIALLFARTGHTSTPFRVNRPFFFGIYNEQAQIFTFLGKIDDPNPNQQA